MIFRSIVEEAAGFDDAEEVPAEFGFALGGEEEGDDGRTCGSTRLRERGVKGFHQEAGEASADAGGVADDVAGTPVFGQGDELAKEFGVLDSGPLLAVDDLVAGVTEGFEEGEVEADDGQGGRISRCWILDVRR